MDALWFLRRRLIFTRNLYDEAAAPFCEKMRRIEAGEEPFVDNRDPFYQDVSEPAFLEEFLNANKAVEALGYFCLLTIYASLQTYLRERAAELLRYRIGSDDLSAKLRATGAGNWFERYRLLFLNEFGLDWSQGPTKLTEIEQINLTRDDLIHNVDVTTTTVYRTKNHSDRFPTGLFTDEMWGNLGIGSKIKIGCDELTKAQQIVDEFCSWLDRS
jgi:hypothetical protein